MTMRSSGHIAGLGQMRRLERNMPRKPAMPARTLKALKASIEKWRKNENGDFQGVFSDSCPLCKLFHDGDNLNVQPDKNCHGCPVFEQTYRPECAGTPWYRARDAYWEEEDRTIMNDGAQFRPQSKRFLEAAKREREFLESLLPKEARK